MPQTVYLESTFISFLAARTSGDLVRASHQRISHEWWDKHRARYTLVTSQLVIAESAAGDPDAAKTRLDLLAPIPILPITEESERIADAILLAKAIPASEPRDALHVGICAAHDIDYLLTWNFKHLANAHMARKIDEVIVASGRRPPLICTPEPLME